MIRTRRPSRPSRPYRWLPAVAIALIANLAPAQETPEKPITRDLITAAIAKVDDAKELAEDAKTALKATYKRAMTDLEKAVESASRADGYAQLKDKAADELAAIQGELEALTAAPMPEVTLAEDATLEAIEAALKQAENDSQSAAAAVANLEKDELARQDRRKQMPQLREAEQKRLDEALAKLRDLVTPPEDPLNPAYSQLLQWRAQQASAEAEIRKLDAEVPSYEARAKALRVQLDLARLQQQRRDALTKQLTDRAQKARARQAELEKLKAEQAVRDAVNSQSDVKALADGNLVLVNERTGPDGLLSRLDEAQRHKTELAALLADLQQSFENTRRLLETGGLSDEVAGALSRREYDRSTVRERNRSIDARDRELVRVSLRKIDLERDRRRFADPIGLARQLADEMTAREGSVDRSTLEPRLRELLTARREAIDNLMVDLDKQAALLTEENRIERDLVRLAQEGQAYVASRMIWIRSAKLLWPEGDGKLALAVKDSVADLLSPANWATIGRSLFDDVHERVAFYIAVLLVIFVLMRVRVILDRLENAKDEDNTTRLKRAPLRVIGSAIDAMVGSAFVPMVMLFLGLRLIIGSDVGEHQKAVGNALTYGAQVLFLLQFLRRLVKPGGMAAEHFDWPKESLVGIGRALATFTLIGWPLMLLTRWVQTRGVPEWDETLGRLSLIGALLLFSILGFSLRRAIVAVIERTQEDGGRPLLWRILIMVMIAYLPILLAGLSFYGYHFAAVQLNERLYPTGWVCVLLVLVNAVVDRWSYYIRRLELISRLRKRREEQAAKEGKPLQPGELDDVDAPSEVDLRKANEQTTRLMKSASAVAFVVALVWIWSDVLPALNVLQQVELWHKSTRVDDQVVVHTITLVDLITALLVALLTIIFARNIPGFLEVALLRRLPIDAGARYAALTLLSYAITIIGLLIGIARIGVEWSDYQWLAAAITVGLGFGLQEIFANFVSGIILLFERPVRVGDTVTIGDNTGTVTRIRMRATTIQDGDNRELIVPNRQLITGALINWSLTDTMVRVVLPVRVAQGSNLRVVERALLDAARESLGVRKEPAPSVVLKGFGENSLDFVLNVFIEVGDGDRVRHALNKDIEAKLRAQKIDVPVPHRVVRVEKPPEPA